MYLFSMFVSLVVSTVLQLAILNWGYADACKIVKGLEPKFGNFVTKAAVIPDAPIETKGPEEDTKVASKKDSKKETKKESAGLSPAETKDSNGETIGKLNEMISMMISMRV